MGTRGAFLGVKRPKHEADHSHPSSAEVHSPNTPSWRGAQLKHRDKFTFTFYYTYIYIYTWLYDRINGDWRTLNNAMKLRVLMWMGHVPPVGKVESYLESLKRKYHLEDLGVDERIILKLIIKEYDMTTWIGFI
jgi:hypothetical protein